MATLKYLDFNALTTLVNQIKAMISGISLSSLSGTLPITKGGTGTTSAAAARTALGAASVALYQVNVTTGWTAASTGYTKTVTVNGITASDVPVVGVVLSSDAAAAQLQGKAFACVNRITTAANSITLYAYSSAPTQAFNIQLLTVRGF